MSGVLKVRTATGPDVWTTVGTGTGALKARTATGPDVWTTVGVGGTGTLKVRTATGPDVWTPIGTIETAASYSHVWSGATPTATVDTERYEMGTWFEVSAPTTLYGVRIWNPGLVDTQTTYTQNRSATLWTHNTSTGTAQRTIDLPDLMTAGWTEHLFSSSYAATSGVNYCVSYFTHGSGGNADYGNVSHGLDSNVTVGPITFVASGGRFKDGVNPGVTLPTLQFANGYYGVDVLY